MKKIILASLASILIVGGVYSQEDNTKVPKDSKEKKEVPPEQKDKRLPESGKKYKSEKPQTDSLKNKADTTRK